MSRTRSRHTFAFIGLVALLATLLPATVAQAAPVGFGISTLSGADGFGYPPTTLQWGPDGRLYVGYFDGTIRAYTVVRNGANSYSVTNTETINAVSNIPNHDDQGNVENSVNIRLMLGIVVTGTAQSPVIYATSSDPRIGAGVDGDDLNLDTNSGTLSRLTKSGGSWNHTVLVRGLPRSEENHGPNGIALSPDGNTLYWAYGGNTNRGGPSFNFAGLPEYAYSAAILKVDLTAITNPPYDLPTLDDSTRGNSAPGVDVRDPFGGNDGANQAKITPGSPVQVHAPGFRNPYDLLIATVGNHAGKMYVPDNGSNGGWGDSPAGEGPAGNCTNALVGQTESGSNDALHLVTSGYYGGHPNPTRANINNTFGGQSPVPASNPVECDFRDSKTAETTALGLLPNSSNGIAEYTTDNFGGAMQGDLVLAGYQGRKIVRRSLNAAGTAVTFADDQLATLGSTSADPRPLDITTMGANQAFPGTIWIAAYKQGAAASPDLIKVLEPNDYDGGGSPCSGADNPNLDEDGDGFSNADEIDNGTSPCSAASSPPDNDGDFVSDLNDTDDDNDGVTDKNDAFAIDPNNGLATNVPVAITWENDDPPAGGIADTGFTGLMTNGTTDYLNQFNPNGGMIVGGAAGVFTVAAVPPGDAFKAKNKQEYGFQLGLDEPSTPFEVTSRILDPYAGLVPGASQSMGIFIGDGTQDGYAKIVLKGTNNPIEKVHMLIEEGGAILKKRNRDIVLPGPDYVDLRLLVKPADGTIQGFAQAFENGSLQPEIKMGGPIPIPSAWFTAPTRGLAVGLISTSAGKAPPFPASWDSFHVDSA